MNPSQTNVLSRSLSPSGGRRLLGALLAPMLLAPGVSALAQASSTTPEKPNIIFILADDLGYGDVQCLNPEGKIATPNMDRIAREGMTFTDAHSGSAVCTPSRYCVLTGRYCWRSELQTGVLIRQWKPNPEGSDPIATEISKTPPLIAADRPTVGGLLQQQGYHTACIGKWHLGLTFPDLKNWNDPILDGPTTRGFNTYFGVSDSLDVPPFDFVENDRLTKKPAVIKTWIRTGPAAADFEASEALPILAGKSVEYLEQRKKAGGPFFLYFPLTSPHTPIAPSAAWKGKSGINAYADFVMESDWAVGEVLKALDRLDLAKDTLIIFSSDNGCSPQPANYKELAKHGHHPSGPFRGAKADIWDGGHRMPLLVRWPGHIAAGSKYAEPVSLTDFMATAADLTGAKLADNAAPDSVSILPALLGKTDKPLRDYIVYHSIKGNFAIQQGKWKLELCPGSGGWSAPNDENALAKGLPPVQLYDTSADIAEKKNLQAEHPEIVERLTKLLEKCVADGRSTPGPVLQNDVPVDIWKKDAKKQSRQKPGHHPKKAKGAKEAVTSQPSPALATLP